MERENCGTSRGTPRNSVQKPPESLARNRSPRKPIDRDRLVRVRVGERENQFSPV